MSGSRTTWPAGDLPRDHDGTGLPLLLTRDHYDGDATWVRQRVPASGRAGGRGQRRGRALSCAYHAWVYRLDGSLARASGMEGVEGFDPADHHLYRVAVPTWARFVFVHPKPDALPFALGPLAAAIDTRRR